MHAKSYRSGLTVFLAFVLIFGALASPAAFGRAAQAQSSAAYLPDSVLVRFKADAQPGQRLEALGLVGGELRSRFTVVPDLEHWRVPAGSVERALEKLASLGFVEYAQPDFIYQASDTVPNDPQFSSLWGMQNIRAPLAWDTYQGDANFVVAVIDTGVDYNHPDLAANMWSNPGEVAGNGIDDDGNGYIDDVRGYDFAYGDSNPSDVFGHGTHVAGTIGAVGNNGVGVVGVNWNIKIASVKFLNDSGSGSTSNAILAVQYCVLEGIKISNNSWGGGAFDQGLYDAINNAKSIGHLFIAAAGNGGSDQVGDNNDTTPHYPSSYNLDNLIAVAAIDSSENKAGFSNYGATSVDLGAPGVGILSTTPNNSYASYNGTSMATPHVSGAAAMVYALHPTWTYAQVRDQILTTVRPAASMSGRTVTGGVLDLANAVGSQPPPPPTPPAAPSGLTASAASSSQINLAWTDNANNETGFKIERCTGAGCTNFAQIATVGANVTSYANTGLAASTSYSYRVRANNTGGDSGYSNTASAMTQSGPASMHLGNLTGSATSQGSRWTAIATITVHNASHQPLAGVVVSARWNNNSRQTGTCTTNSSGQCSISRASIPNRTTSIPFSVTGMTLSGYTYSSASNEVSSSITISR